MFCPLGYRSSKTTFRKKTPNTKFSKPIALNAIVFTLSYGSFQRAKGSEHRFYVNPVYSLYKFYTFEYIEKNT